MQFIDEHRSTDPVTEVCPLGHTIGANGITIAWDAAIEKGDWLEIKDTTVAINIRTIIRNAMDAYSISDPTQPNLEERIREDILLISQYFSDVHNSSIHIYAINYDRLPVAGLPNYRTPKTDKQKARAKVAAEMLEKLRDCIARWYDMRITFDGGYLISHIVYDMLLVPKHVKLIETHSGAIKSHIELNSKLNLNESEILTVPFNPITYALYGDRQLLNKNTKITNSLLKLLLDAAITPLSTESRLSMAIKNRDPILYRIIRKVLP